VRTKVDIYVFITIAVYSSTQKGGDSVRTCQVDGTWEGKPIVCVASGKYLLSVRMDINANEHTRLSISHLDSN
jgi:hypothetical protein